MSQIPTAVQACLLLLIALIILFSLLLYMVSFPGSLRQIFEWCPKFDIERHPVRRGEAQEVLSGREPDKGREIDMTSFTRSSPVGVRFALQEYGPPSLDRRKSGQLRGARSAPSSQSQSNQLSRSLSWSSAPALSTQSPRGGSDPEQEDVQHPESGPRCSRTRNPQSDVTGAECELRHALGLGISLGESGQVETDLPGPRGSARVHTKWQDDQIFTAEAQETPHEGPSRFEDRNRDERRSSGCFATPVTEAGAEHNVRTSDIRQPVDWKSGKDRGDPKTTYLRFHGLTGVVRDSIERLARAAASALDTKVLQNGDVEKGLLVKVRVEHGKK